MPDDSQPQAFPSRIPMRLRYNTCSMIKTIITDCFGVLVSNDFGVFREVFHVEDPEPIYACFRAADEGKDTFRHALEAVGRLLQVPPYQIRDAILNYPEENRQYTDYLRQLKRQGYQIILLSDAPDTTVEYQLERFQLNDLFNLKFISYQTGVTKHDPEGFRSALRKSRTKPKEAIFIDDSLSHVARAHDLGIHSILFTDEMKVTAAINLLLK